MVKHEEPRCEVEGCSRLALRRFKVCSTHGAGNPCGTHGCPAKAVQGYSHCRKHGGGKRCIKPDCDRSAASGYVLCTGHGGGWRCMSPDCGKIAIKPTDFCMGHSPRCVVPRCGAGAPHGSLCKWHQVHGADKAKTRDWRLRTRRIYVVFWPTHQTFKVGVEASALHNRVNKWASTGGELVGLWELLDTQTTRNCLTFVDVEQTVLARLRREGFQSPENDLWLPVVGPTPAHAERADGRTETFLGDEGAALAACSYISEALVFAGLDARHLRGGPIQSGEEGGVVVGLYDTPVDAFAELHPTSTTRRRRKAPTTASQGDTGETTPTVSQTATKVAQDFYDSVNGLVDFQKVRAVAVKALKGGYPPDQVLSAFTRAHKDGRPLTAEVLHQYLEGYVQPRGAGRPDKAIHYAADRKADPSEYPEDL